jgi:hypothetical protein
MSIILGRQLSIVVIGCGPAGLAAAHAAVGLGCRVEVFAPKSKTPQKGPLLIQRPIPGINTDHPFGTVRQIVIGGSILDYRYKLYNDINIGINGDILQPFYHAWNHQVTYDELWRRYSGLIHDCLIRPDEMNLLPNYADLVVSTANARNMCDRHPYPPEYGGHEFISAEVLVTPRASYPDQEEDTIIFNAGDEFKWVRSSRIFGNEVTEWLPGTEIDGARKIWKPISSTCDCYPRVLRTGRFGAWRNETWVDTAYWDTYNAVKSILTTGKVSE